MKAQKVVKFNLWMSVVLFVGFAAMLVATTIAYFTAMKQVTNTFTAGNVKLVLTESAVKPDASGNLVKDPDKSLVFGGDSEVLHHYGHIYPGLSIFKDPTITNTGDVPAWIAAKVTLTDGAGDLHKLIGYPENPDLDIELLLSGGLLDEKVHVTDWNGIPYVCVNENYAMVQKSNAPEGKYEFWFLMLKPMGPGEKVTVFDQLTFSPEWNNGEMQELADFKINVQAFGVQTFQMESCLDAMTKAFPEHFKLT